MGDEIVGRELAEDIQSDAGYGYGGMNYGADVGAADTQGGATGADTPVIDTGDTPFADDAVDDTGDGGRSSDPA